MIGSRPIRLVPATWRRWFDYHATWMILRDEQGARQRFGSHSKPIEHPNAFHYRFLIYYGDNVSIGVADIYKIEQTQTCTLVLGLLAPFRGQKFGAVAARLMIRKCFTELGARRVESTALASNPASIQMQDGMKQEGIRRGAIVIEGQAVDEILFGLLKEEWWGNPA